MSAVEMLYEQALRLGREEQLHLLERLTAMVQKPVPGEDLLALRGLGAELWKGEDIDQYIRKEREW